jgi:putative transposase
MTTLDGVTKKKQAEPSAEQQAAVELVRLAQEQGLSADRPGCAAQTADQDGARRAE